MKKLIWAVIIIAAVLYSGLIYKWWQEGSRHFEWQQWCAQYKNELDENLIPKGCKPYLERR